MNMNNLNKIYIQIKSGDTLLSVCDRLNLTVEEVTGLVELFKLNGKNISIEENNNELVIVKNRIYTKTNKQKLSIDELILTKLLVVSDTHLCSKCQQLSLLNEVYKEAHKRGIETVLHVGDLLDGDYHTVRPDHLYQVFRHGFTEQTDYAVSMYPHIKGMKTYFITGSHDDTHLKNGGGFVGKEIAEKRRDMVFLGQDEGMFHINNLRLLLKHPGGGSSKYWSYKPQGIVDSLDSGNKPQITLIGHFHKCHYMLYRNVHTFSVPCFVSSTPFIARNSLTNIVGAYFIDIYSTQEGEIQYICPEEYLFGQDDIIEDDYKRCKKLDID